MVWNEALKREVPEGWIPQSLGSLLAHIPTTRRLATNEYRLAGNYPIIDQSDTFVAGYTSDSSAVLDIERCVVFGDHSCTVKMINFPFCRGAEGTQIIVSNDESCISTYQLYQYILHLKFDGHYKRHFSSLKQYLIPLYRNLHLGAKFADRISPLYNSIRNCRESIAALTIKRDTLLPLLMNGQVAVKD